jgi:hypothetical protein
MLLVGKGAARWDKDFLVCIMAGVREGRKFGGELSKAVVLAGQLKSNNQPKFPFSRGTSTNSCQ